MMILSIVFLVIIVVASFAQVFSRYILNNSMSWTEESARYAFVWLSMCGATIAAKKGSHATIMVLGSLLKGNAKYVHEIVINLFILIAALLMTVEGVRMVLATTKQLSTALRIPMSCVYGAVPVCGIVLGIHAVCKICEDIATIRDSKRSGGIQTCQDC